MKTKRPPIIVILGSVDHGKTTLLDYIRKTNVVAKEAGGITQAVGAYEIVHNNARVTFIDTPGHEAFTQMRKRGTHIADIGILVVAADDGVKPQTKESIKILKESKTPFIVAINKVDTPGADVSRVKNELAQEEVLLEGYGGNVSNQEVSAKTGQGINDLLDLILLASEIEELTSEAEAPLEGFILESHIDNRRGVVATAIVRNGTLRVGDEIFAGSASGKVRSLENFLGEQKKELTPSSPAVILGFGSLPGIGDTLSGEMSTESSIETDQAKEPAAKLLENSIRLLLKADTAGSLEALSETVQGLSHLEQSKNQKLLPIHIVERGVGNVTDGDVKLAASTNATIIGFNTKTSKAAENLARGQSVHIITSGIIYELLKAIEEAIEVTSRAVLKGKLEILGTFGKKDEKQIIGGKVVENDIKNKSIMEVHRNNKMIGEGKIVNLQSGKKDAEIVESGNECGMVFDSRTNIKIGDILIEK